MVATQINEIVIRKMVNDLTSNIMRTEATEMIKQKHTFEPNKLRKFEMNASASISGVEKKF